MSDDLAALTRQLGVCELQEQRLLRAVQLATSSRDQETEQLDQCKQNLVEAEQSTAEDMLDICRTLSARSEAIYDTITKHQDNIQRLNMELNATTLKKIALTNTIQSHDAASHTNPLTPDSEDDKLRNDPVKVRAQALDGDNNISVPPLADEGHRRGGTAQHADNIDDLSAIAVPPTPLGGGGMLEPEPALLAEETLDLHELEPDEHHLSSTTNRF